MDQVQDNLPIDIACPQDAINAWAIVDIDVVEKLIDKETLSKSLHTDSQSNTEI